MKKLWLLLSIASLSVGQSLVELKIDEIIRTSKSLEPGAIGVQVVQLRSGKVLYARNADKLFTPASNTKLFSTALALTRLGKDHRIPTRIYVPSAPDTRGAIAGATRMYSFIAASASCERVVSSVTWCVTLASSSAAGTTLLRMPSRSAVAASISSIE